MIVARRGPWLAGLAAILLVGAAAAWTSRDLRVDDALITYRYARNIVSGEGWVYNAGEPHNTATSPLYTALVAGVGALAGDIPRAGHLIGSASLIACAVLTALIVAGAGFPVAGVLAGLFIVINPLLLLTVSMETPLFLALCAGAVLLASDPTRVTSAVGLASLATLTRGEAIVLVVLIYGLSVWRERRLPWRPVAVSLAVALPWAVYATAGIGSPVPDSLGAKAALGVGLGMPSFAVVRQAPEILWQFGLATVINFVPFVLAPLGVARMGAAGWLLAVSAGAQIALHGALRVPPQHWYYALPMLAAVVAAGCGAGWVAGRLRRPARIALWVCLAVGVAVAAPTGLSLTTNEDANYVDAGRWLRAHGGTGDSVAAVEIGAIGWYSGLTVVDPLGLGTPASDRVRRGDFIWWLEQRRPTFILLHRPVWPWVEHVVARHPSFQRDYEEAIVVGAPGPRQCVIYRRRRM